MKHNYKIPSTYKVFLSKDAVSDIKGYKTYIKKHFGYDEYAKNFSHRMKAAIQSLNSFPYGYPRTPFTIEELDIYYKPYDTYLIFFVVRDRTVIILRVFKDRMHWQHIISKFSELSIHYFLS